MMKWGSGRLMKQIEKNKLCNYCMGCMKLENEQFNGVHNCSNFIQIEPGWQKKMWKELKK